MRIEKDSPVFDIVFACAALVVAILLSVALNSGCGRVAEAADVSVLWDNPTINGDGGVLVDLRGVQVLFWSRSAPAVAYTSPVIYAPSTGGGTGSVMIRGLSDGTWVFTAIALDAVGNSSARATSINAALNGRPGPPTRLRFR